jgi:general secretion pathway protein G
MSRQQGFSLIEIMVVVVIMGILAALIVPNIMNRPDQARTVKAKQDILALENALELYRLDNGFYPSNEQGLDALVKQPSSDPMPSNWRNYLKSLPKDPWGHNYHYENPGQHGEIDIFSEGTSGKDHKVIGNWPEQENSNSSL